MRRCGRDAAIVTELGLGSLTMPPAPAPAFAVAHALAHTLVHAFTRARPCQLARYDADEGSVGTMLCNGARACPWGMGIGKGMGSSTDMTWP